MAGPGVLTVTFEVKPEGEDLVGRWYREEHIPDRLAIDGFRAIRRYRSMAAPLRHMAVWDVDDAAWPFAPEYRSIPHDPWTDLIGHLRGPSTRVGWEEVSTRFTPNDEESIAFARPGIRVVEMDIPVEHEDEFNDWYEQEHIPDLMRRTEYLGIRRFRRLDSAPGSVTYAAMWELADVGLHARPDYVAPPPTEWTQRVGRLRTRSERASWEQIDLDLGHDQ